MRFWQRWLRQPRTVFLRKACFQIHLWVGLAIGLYVVVLSLTGSALVFRNELDRAFSPDPPAIDKTARIRSPQELTGAAQRAYPGFAVESVGVLQQRSPVVQISLRQGGDTIERVFNAYTGEDLGDPFPMASRALLWITILHDDLLVQEEERGRFWNGVGSILTTLLCLTGMVIWWPGIASWRRGLSIRWRSAWPRFTFDLHSTIGFWFVALIAIWGVSGIYLSMPTPFMAVVDWVAGPAQDEMRPIDIALEWLPRLHFGRWRSHTLKVVWVVLGLVPAAMFVTGAIMWWNRVVRKSRAAAAP
ncbi:MAG: PepSY domain-containing protein [Acidobacteria bacterium]|nr:PepSY domain-containing protein [Acidobacteriota bacterium]